MAVMDTKEKILKAFKQIKILFNKKGLDQEVKIKKKKLS